MILVKSIIHFFSVYYREILLVEMTHCGDIIKARTHRNYISLLEFSATIAHFILRQARHLFMIFSYKYLLTRLCASIRRLPNET